MEDDKTWVDGPPLGVETMSLFPDVHPLVIDDELGQGGMSTVYRGRDPNGRPLAIKVLQDASQKSQLRFLREASVRLEHDNVVRVLDAGQTSNGVPYIALELLVGETLAERLRREALDLTAVVDVGMQTAAGLAAIHDAGIVHRDLKPSNLFVCEDGRLKVLDFGVARHDDELGLTTPGAAIGTPKYMSPEQARGEPTVDERSDIWSLGAVLYEALAGFAPFERGAAVPTLLAAARGVARPLSEVAPHVPAGLARVVQRAVAPRPEERYASAAELHDALATAQLDEQERIPTRTPPGVLIEPGERRIVAVMFASEVDDPQRLSGAVEKNGGSFSSLAGRRAIGLFGVDAWRGDEVLRAVSAGLEVRSSARHIGVAAGHTTRAKDHIAGRAIDLAVEGAGLALEGIAIDVESARPLVATFPLRRVGPLHVEVTTERRPSTSTAERLRPAVGRARELEAVERALYEALDARRSTIAVLRGVAGVGKTRLAEEVLAGLVRRVDGVEVVRGVAPSHREGDAFSLFAGSLKDRYEQRAAAAGWPPLRPGVPLVQRQRAIRRFLQEAGVDSERLDDGAASIGLLLGVTAAADTGPGGEDLVRGADRIRAALYDLFDGLTRKHPVVLFVDQVDWADSSSRALVLELVEQLAERPFAVLLASREACVDVSRFEHGLDVALDELPRAAALELATRQAGGHLTAEQLASIVERAEGNPSFVEQLVRVARDHGTEAEAIALPLSVEAAVQARIDALEPTLRRLVVRLSLFGRPFAVHEARAIVRGMTDAALDALVMRGFLHRSQERLAFTSALLGEVAARLITEDVRRRLHERIAETLSRYPDTDPFEVAEHLRAAGRDADASLAYRRAAKLAAMRGDSKTILRATERALACGLQDGLAEIHLLRAQAHRFLGEASAQSAALDAAALFATDRRDGARVALERALLLARKGRRREAIDEGRRAIERARDAEDEPLMLLAEGRRAMTLVQDGQLDEAAAVLARIAPRVARAAVDLRARAAGWRGQLAAARGDHGASRVAFAEAATAYTEAGDLRLAASANANLADLDNRLGDHRAAARNLRRAADECRRVGHHNMEGYALANLGYALTKLGRFPAALAAYRDAALVLRSTPDPRLSIYMRLYRAGTVLASGRVEGVRATAEQIAREAENRDLATPQALALALAARAALREDRPHDALARIEAARALVDDPGVDEDEAEIFAVHVQVLEALERRAEADEVAARGAERIRTHATRIEDPEARRRFCEEVDVHRRLLER